MGMLVEWAPRLIISNGISLALHQPNTAALHETLSSQLNSVTVTWAAVFAALICSWHNMEWQHLL